MYQHVLIPTDGSDRARASIREGVELAAVTGATVHALYVVDNRDYNTLPESKWLAIEEALESEGEQAVAVVEEEATNRSVPVTTTVARGIPHKTILEYVDDHDVDVVVMGTHGRTGVDRFLLGSVTEKLIRSATVPVHVVRITDEEDD